MSKTFVPGKAPSAPAKRSPDAEARRSVQPPHATVAVDPLLLARLAHRPLLPTFDEPSSVAVYQWSSGTRTDDQTRVLELLREQIVSAATEELSGSDWTAEGCPWIEYWLSYYEGRKKRERHGGCASSLRTPHPCEQV